MHSTTYDFTYYIDSKDQNASGELSHFLTEVLKDMKVFPELKKSLVFVCIGSDRVTGDSLGPLIGTQLKRRMGHLLPVYGTLDSPIHALNLKDSIEYIKKRHSDSIIIAIDASLGSKHHQGFISIGKGSILPGAGVNKQLDAVGDLFITGIISTAGRFSHLALQTTRLSTVVFLAECIMTGLLLTFQEFDLHDMHWKDSVLFSLA